MSFHWAAQQALKNKGSSYVALALAASTLGIVRTVNEKKGSENDQLPEEGGRTSDGDRVHGEARAIITEPWTRLHMPLLSDVSRASCSAAAAVNGNEEQVKKADESSPSDNKDSEVIAPNLMEEHQHQPASRAGTEFTMRRRATLARLSKSKSRHTLESKYEVDPDPIGEGAFGKVYCAKDRKTGEQVAVKKIWKEFSDNIDFVREMSTLLQIRSAGGHPHICQLRENFDEPEHYALVLDLIKGGEMFDHLVENGAYSELDGIVHNS